MPDIKQIPLSDFGNALAQRQSAFQASAEADKAGMFPKGKPADPMLNMTDEQKAEWKKQIEEHGDKFKSKSASVKSEALRAVMALEQDSEQVAGLLYNLLLQWQYGPDDISEDFGRLTQSLHGGLLPAPPRSVLQKALGAVSTPASMAEFLSVALTAVGEKQLAAKSQQLIRMAADESDTDAMYEGGEKLTGKALADWKKKHPDLAENAEDPPPEVKALKDKMKSKTAGSGANNKEYLDNLPTRQRDHMLKEIAKHYGISTEDAYEEVIDKDAEKLYEYLATNRSLAMVVYGDFRNFRFASTRERLTRERLTWDPAVRAKLASRDKEARAAAGLYGYTKKVQSDCEACSRKLARKTASIARTAWNKDERVAAFLQTHAKRSKSRSAKLLVAALKNLGPKVASSMDKTAAGSGAANATYLDSLPGMEKLKILKHLAKHYGVSVREIEDEVKDRDAEALYEYTATDRSMTMGIYNDFKRKGLMASKTALNKGVRQLLEQLQANPNETLPLKEATWLGSRRWDNANVLGNLGLVAWAPGGRGLQLTPEGKRYRLASAKTASDKEASYGMYGASAKVARLGLTACASLKEAAGELAADLHRRRASSHASYTGFLGEHSKTARDGYSRMLLGFYPDSGSKCASVAPPDSVDEWLAWEG